jgi:predicted nucleotide-binding protein
VLVQMGVPRDSGERTLELILGVAKSVGFLTEIKGVSYVKLEGAAILAASSDGQQTNDVDPSRDRSTNGDTTTLPPQAKELPQFAGTAAVSTSENRKVFITHGKNTAFLEPLKDLLAFGELEPVVSIERESVSQPVPDKVLEDMRKCGAAIIHVDAEQKLLDQDAKSHVVLNPNVLIEIGAAMALYHRRFILLVREGVDLPSNLQGLYQVRYSGDRLDGESTIKLLKAIKDIKNHALPQLTTRSQGPSAT